MNWLRGAAICLFLGLCFVGAGIGCLATHLDGAGQTLFWAGAGVCVVGMVCAVQAIRVRIP